MAGRTWIKMGVMGTLTPIAQKGFGRLAKNHHGQGLDFFVTSIREGTHSPGSLHYSGNAFDYQPQNSIRDDRKILGEGWDVVESNAGARHAEWDPK
tara:strand:- start:6072 stop:6359 length:288 start_codon:yes stop_codon:yes gene_type:complete